MRKILFMCLAFLLITLAGCDKKKSSWEDGLDESTKPTVYDQELLKKLAANPTEIKKMKEQCDHDFREMERKRRAGEEPYDKKLADRCSTIDKAYNDYLNKKYSN